MKKRLILLWSLLLFSLCTNVWADIVTSREEVLRIVEKAVAYAKANGKEKAIAAFNDPKYSEFFTKGGALYIFAYTMEGINLALPAKTALNGKDLSKMQDSEGHYIIQQFIKIGKDGGKGWTSYRDYNPKVNKVDEKVVYVVGMGDWLLGSGIYESDCPYCFIDPG